MTGENMTGHGTKRHAVDADLALYAAGDLPVYRRAPVWLHARACEACQARIRTFQADRKELLSAAGELPPDVSWDRLAAEMTANIHLGLSAGECVAPHPRRRRGFARGLAPGFTWPWRPAALVAGVMVLVSAAWWLNMPPSDAQALGRVMRGIVHGGRRSVFTPSMLGGDAGPVVEATPAGVELRENGGALGVAQIGLRPLTVSVSVQGSASARYIDTDTGQVTITSVYAQ
jgi:hypothetical protein